jgi:predicted transcriptional regulator
MEVQFSPATEALLQNLANSQGKNAAQVVQETVTRVLEQQADFLAGIERGIDDSKRGNMVSHDEVVARIHRIFNKS